MYFSQLVSSPFNAQNAKYELIISTEYGFIIAAESPFSIAIVKKVLLIIFLAGRPNDTFETPNDTCAPSMSFIILTVLNVSIPALLSALTVRARGSNTMSLLSIPKCSAVANIFFAISNRSSAFSGMPCSSSVRATITPPYFLAMGKTASMLSSLPFTEFIIAFPLYLLKADSMAFMSEVSTCKGRSIIA